jgi:phosphoribosyl 1,2-cyclic phosphodiesterase
MRVASIGSGSKGNCTLVQNGSTQLLIDLGFTIREAEKRLKRIGVDPAGITAILVTHEHSDHLNGVAPFARKFNLPVYMTPGTYSHKKVGVVPELKLINCHASFQIDELEIVPVPVPHDAREPCQYVISNSTHSFGILTDLGHITTHVIEQYRRCDGILLESNHDSLMLAEGPYPYPLKKRVAGEQGHLSNQQAAGLLSCLELAQLEQVVIAHISEQNNCLEKIKAELDSVLLDWQGQLTIADQEKGFDWLTFN